MNAEYDFSEGRRGPVVRARGGKTRITIRIDDDIPDWFQSQAHAAGEGSYRTLIHSAPRVHIEAEEKNIEETLRRVIREELPGYGNR